MASKVDAASIVGKYVGDLFDGRQECGENEYFELRIPENIVELQQNQTLSEEDSREFLKCLCDVEKINLEVFRCKSCKYRCIFREEIIQHIRNVHYDSSVKEMSSIATVIDVLMEGLSSEVQKSQNYTELNPVAIDSIRTSHEKPTGSDTLQSVVTKIVMGEVMSIRQEIREPIDKDYSDSMAEDCDESYHTEDNDEPHTAGNNAEGVPKDNAEPVAVENSVKTVANAQPIVLNLPETSAKNHVQPILINLAESLTNKDDVQSAEIEIRAEIPKNAPPLLNSMVDLTAIAKSAAACNPNATKITVFQHTNDSDQPTAIHFRISKRSNAIIPTNDSLGISSPFLKSTYRGKKHFACAQCHSRYKTELELKNHVKKKHKRTASVLCEICGLELASETSAKYHIERMHHTTGEVLHCYKCDYVTRFPKRLKIHQAKHDSSLFNCATCDKSYVSQQKLDRHYQSPMHKNVVNPLICEHCGYSTNKKDNFLVHMRKHTGERPYKCNKCPYASADGSTLKKHVMAKHSNIRPFKCEYCPFSSVDKKGLTVHVRKHTGERPFRCTLCNYAAKRRSALNMHMQTHVQDKRGLYKNKQPDRTAPNQQGSPKPTRLRKILPLPVSLVPAGQNESVDQIVPANQPTKIIEGLANSSVINTQLPNQIAVQNQGPNQDVMIIQTTTSSAGIAQTSQVSQAQASVSEAIQAQSNQQGTVHIQTSIAGGVQIQTTNLVALQCQTSNTAPMQTQQPNQAAVQNLTSNSGFQVQDSRPNVLQTQSSNEGVIQTEVSNLNAVQKGNTEAVHSNQ